MEQSAQMMLNLTWEFLEIPHLFLAKLDGMIIEQMTLLILYIDQEFRI